MFKIFLISAFIIPAAIAQAEMNGLRDLMSHHENHVANDRSTESYLDLNYLRSGRSLTQKYMTRVVLKDLAQHAFGEYNSAFKKSLVGVEFRNLSKLKPYLQWKKIRQVLSPTDGAYYCANLKAVDPDEYWNSANQSQECLNGTRDLISPILDSKKFNVYLVVVDGDYYGNYQEVSVIFQSKKRKNRAVKYSFDIVHEI